MSSMFSDSGKNASHYLAASLEMHDSAMAPSKIVLLRESLADHRDLLEAACAKARTVGKDMWPQACSSECKAHNVMAKLNWKGSAPMHLFFECSFLREEHTQGST
eukprot:3206067-Amphidinium_carterae.1